MRYVMQPRVPRLEIEEVVRLSLWIHTQSSDICVLARGTSAILTSRLFVPEWVKIRVI